MLDTTIGGYRLPEIDRYLESKSMDPLSLYVSRFNKEEYKVQIHSRYKTKKDFYPHYLRGIKISCRHNKNKYLRFFCSRVAGYPNSYDIKMQSELSHFENINDFLNFCYGFGNFEKPWTTYLNNFVISNIHLKMETPFDFELYRECLSYRHCRKPKIIKNKKTEKRTLYLSRNLYIYEKNGGCRIEKRIKRSGDIKKTLNLCKFEDLEKYGSKIKNPFKEFIFLNPYKLKKRSLDDMKDVTKISYQY